MIFRAFFRALALVLIVIALPAQAQTYRWTDEKGQTRVTDTPPPPGAKDVRRIGAAPAKPAAGAEAAQQTPFELQKLQKDFPVSLYTAPICKDPCALARALLNKRGIPFTEIQVWNQETLEQLKKVSGNDSVPVLVVGRSVQNGFEQGRYDALLDSAGYPASGVFPARAQAVPAPPEGYEPPPTAEPVKPEETAKPGPYDPSGLKGPEPKPGIYDPSGLQGPPPKQGPYRVPSDTKK
jgi:glutaredoxin